MKLLKSLGYYLQTNRPLGWAQLSHQKVRLAVAMTGVAFSNILIFTQLGLRALLFDGITLLPESLEGDLFLLSTYSQSIDLGSAFPRVYLYQADAVPGVAYTSPIYIRTASWVNPEDLKPENRAKQKNKNKGVSFPLFSNNVKVIAFNPTRPVLNLPEVNQNLDKLHIPDSVLYDRLGQDKLGAIPELFSQQGKVSTIMNNRRVDVVGLFSLGSTLFDNGRVVMSDWNYARRWGQTSLENVSIGTLTLEVGANRETVQAQLREYLSKDIKVLTREELIQAEQDFRASLPNGKILNFGAAIGFVVGLVVVYQVLYTDVNDHLPEYATLKAMGYSDFSLLIVVLQESLILGILGFVPGYLTSAGTYILLTNVTKIPLAMRPEIAIQVFILTLIMCAISGAMAMNKLRSADPADVF